MFIRHNVKLCRINKSHTYRHLHVCVFTILLKCLCSSIERYKGVGHCFLFPDCPHPQPLPRKILAFSLIIILRQKTGFKLRSAWVSEKKRGQTFTKRREVALRRWRRCALKNPSRVVLNRVGEKLGHSGVGRTQSRTSNSAGPRPIVAGGLAAWRPPSLALLPRSQPHIASPGEARARRGRGWPSSSSGRAVGAGIQGPGGGKLL